MGTAEQTEMMRQAYDAGVAVGYGGAGVSTEAGWEDFLASGVARRLDDESTRLRLLAGQVRAGFAASRDVPDDEETPDICCDDLAAADELAALVLGADQ